MAGKKIIRGSPSQSVDGRRNDGNMQRNNHINSNLQCEAGHRQEIFRLLSENLINPEFARFAWFESIERDLRQLRVNLQALERAISGGGKCGHGKNQLKRKPKGL